MSSAVFFHSVAETPPRCKLTLCSVFLGEPCAAFHRDTGKNIEKYSARPGGASPQADGTPASTLGEKKRGARKKDLRREKERQEPKGALSSLPATFSPARTLVPAISGDPSAPALGLGARRRPHRRTRNGLFIDEDLNTPVFPPPGRARVVRQRGIFSV